MSRLIAVCGSPASGKTTLALKLAQETYFNSKKPVLFISPDTNTPTLSYLLPRRKDTELFSLGAVLDKTTITNEEILKQIVTIGSMKEFGILGLKTGENKYSFPKPSENKIREFFIACKSLAPIVFVDCSSCFDDLISEMAMREADIITQVISPDIRSMAYYSAYEEKYNAVSDKCVKVINILDNDIFLPLAEVKAHFKNVGFILPYSQILKRQAITGTLTDKITDSKYKTVCTNIARTVTNRWSTISNS